MIDSNCWRQPVPTDFMEYGGFTYIEKMLLCMIIMKAQRNPTDIVHWSGNKRFDIHLEVGQCFLVGADIVRETGISATKISRSMKIISEKYTNVKYSSLKYGYFISVLEYDIVTSMKDSEHTVDTQRTYSKDTVEIPNIDKTDKTDKTDKRKQLELAVASLPANRREMAELLFTQMQINNPDARTPNLDQWALDMDKIMRIDKREERAVSFLIRWSQQDDFWKANILSPKKLREKWDQLFLQAKRQYEQRKKNTIPSFD